MEYQRIEMATACFRGLSVNQSQLDARDLRGLLEEMFRLKFVQKKNLAQ